MSQQLEEWRSISLPHKMLPTTLQKPRRQRVTVCSSSRALSLTWAQAFMQAITSAMQDNKTNLPTGSTTTTQRWLLIQALLLAKATCTSSASSKPDSKLDPTL